MKETPGLYVRNDTDLVAKVIKDSEFGAEGMEVTGETTLKVLKDFVEGRGVQIDVSEGEKLAAMATHISQTRAI